MLPVQMMWAQAWDGTTKTQPEGSGTASNPYVINTAEEFAWFGDKMNNNAQYWVLGDDIDLGNQEWKKGGNSGATFKGHFDGKGHTVSNVSITTVSGKNNGLFCNISGTSASERAEVKNLKISNVTFADIEAAAANNTKVGAIAGYTKWVDITNVHVDGVSFTVNGNVTGAVYIAGAVGHVENGQSQMKGVTVKDATFTVNGNSGSTLYLCGLFGYVNGQKDQLVNVFNCKVENPVLTLTGDVTSTTYIGGAIGMTTNYTAVDGIYVKGGSINGPTTTKTITNNKEFWVGGAVGKQNSSGTAVNQPNYVHNVAVSGMTIDLGKYEAAGIINNHKFGVGGVIGTVNSPNDDKNGRRGMPENLLFKGGKIYAPHAATSPTVANFNASLANYNNYTGENYTSNIDCIEKSKAGTWLYSDYELGLSSELLNWEKIDSWDAAPAQNKWRKNFEDTKLAAADANGVRYLSVNDETFKKQNRRLDNERPSKTVLWWTNQQNYATTGVAATYFTESEQPIYPQNNFGTVGQAELTKFPYYMYFYQGVANAKYIKGANADEIIKGIEANITEAAKTTPLTLTLRDNKIKYSDVPGSKDVRGFDAHTLTVTPSDDDAVDSYKWYVDGVEQDGATTNTFNVKPDWKTGKSIIVNAIKDEAVVASAGYALRVGVLKTKAGDTEEVGSDINSRGTKTNPYIIDSPEALRQLSMLSTLNTAQIWEGLTKPAANSNTGGVANQSQGHYNRAYYELGADIDLNNEPFIPISHVGTNGDGTDGTYTNNWIFQGNFDGKGHKISNLNVTWSAGNYNGNNANQYWGLFGALGHTVLTAKWGDGTSTSNTVVKNLVIDGATFTHDKNNKTFYYGNGSITSTNSNRAMVGVLAGIVASNTTVENIEIRNSKITDDGSNNYDLAAQGLYVGGAIGSMQTTYNADNNMPVNMVVRNIVADVDITLTHPKFHDDSKPAEVGVFNVGGIIGRVIATSQATSIQTIMPSYTFFKGTVNAPKAWISPVIGAVRYNNQQGISFANYTKQWEGNNGTAATQHNVTNAAYYKYSITVDGTPMTITESYPDEECGLGSRTIAKHMDNAYGDDKRELQGVNYNAKYISSEDAPFDVTSGKILAIGMLNEGLDNQGVKEFTWEWNETEDMPSIKMGTVTEQEYTYLTRGTGTDLNAMRVNTSYANATYKWYKYNNSNSTWVEMDGVTTYAYTANPDKGSNDYYKAEVYVDAVKMAETQTMMVKFVPMHSNFRINLAAATDNNVYSIAVSGDDVPTGNVLTTQWYKADGTTLFTDGVDDEHNTLTLTDAVKAENKKVFCLVSVTDNSTHKTIFSQMVSYYNVGKVVYLMLNTDNASVNASNGMTYTYKATDKEQPNWGRTPDNPANSWADAYSLLDAYTPAAITNGGYKKTQVKIDDSKNLVTVDDNIIVVMGLAKNNYFDNNNGVDGTVASKPATVTGKWDGVDYHGCICNTSDHLSLNADHKFENIGFSISTSGRFRIYAHRWNIHMGKGILMGYEAGLAAGKDDANNYKVNYADLSTGTPVGHRAADIAVMGGYLNDGTSDNPEKNQFVNHGRTEGQIIRLESGLWGPVCPGNRQTGECVSYYIMGGPENPAKTTFIIDIDQAWNEAHSQYKKGEFATLDVGCLLSGNHEGTMYADVVLDIRSGKMGRVVNGIKGSQRVVGQNTGFKTGSTNYRHIVRNIDSNGEPVDGTGVGNTTGSGTKWLYTSAPPPDSYIGRGIINISPAKAVNYTASGSMNDRVSVVELYCGGLGRCHNDGYFHPEVVTNFFGQSIVNIEGGTFYNTIYGAGAGGVNGIGTDDNHNDDNGIPFYPGGDVSNVWYASYEYLKETGNLGNIVPVAYHNNESMLDRNGATMANDGTVDLRDTYTFINITGGVFGSETSPVSIYAGGSGETNDALINMVDAPATTDVKNAVQTPNHQAGCIFGNGKGVASEIRISNATIYGNIYGGGKGSAKYYRWISLTPTTTPDNIVNKSNYATTAFQDYTRMSQPANYAAYLVEHVKKLRSKADNYLNLGQVYGDTKITLGNNAVIHGNVFGGGEGVADMTQEDFIAGTGMTLTLDNASLNISNMTGERTSKSWVLNSFAEKQYISFPDMGKVFGKAQVNIEDGAIIHGNVYGGGDAGSIKGIDVDGSGNPIVAKSSEVNIKGGEIYGSVFGAGKGLTIDKAANYEEVATIIGDATVNLTGGTIWQNMYGGGQNAVVNGDTYFNMSGGNIAANVYGGGMGNVEEIEISSVPTTVITNANIYGNTYVDITGGQIVWNRSSLSGEQEIDVTIYNYTRNVPAETVTDEEYESSTDDTADKVQTTYTAQNYTGVTATAQSPASKEEDGITYYLWKVTYTKPAYVETVSFDYEANPEGYTPAPSTTEKRKLIAGQVINWNINDPSSAYYSNFYDEINGKFNIEHNIFGGGYLACNVGKYYNDGDEIPEGKAVGDLVDNTGKATVNMTKGLFGMDLLRTHQWQRSYNDNENPHFYVFGGGYGVHTKVETTDVDVNIANGGGSVETDEQLAKPMRVKAIPTDEEEMDIITDAYGQANATVLGVLGGGYNGWVGKTDVLIDGDTYCHRAYGGGLGSYLGWVDAGKPTAIGKMTDVTGYVGITDETKIEVAGGNIYGDVFGGGAGVAPNDKEGELTDYTEIARTKGDTYVIISDNANIFGRVFGGGDVANVGRAYVAAHDDVPEVTATESTVEIVGGNIYGDLFGGGSGRKANEAKVYSSLGNVAGNTVVTISKTDAHDEEPEIIPSLYGSIYGGCAYGTVNGNAVVTVDGGNIGKDIFGGGFGDVAEDASVTSADILGTTTVNINGGKCMWDKISDLAGNIRLFDRALYYRQGDTDYTAINSFYDREKQIFLVDHNIYGGGNVASQVKGSATLTVNHGLLDDDMLLNNEAKNYIGGKKNIPLGWWCYYNLIDQVQHPQFSVLGGGYGVNTSVASTVVKVEVGNRQGETKEYAAKESDNQRWVSNEVAMYTDWGKVSTADKTNLYGGENHNAYRRYRSSRLAWSSGVPSHTYLSIIGGGFAGKVGYEESEGNGNTSVTVDNYTCARNIFGGGIGMLPEEPNGDEAYGLVMGDASVIIGGGVISQNVYGGGAGVPSLVNGEDEYVDFPAMAQVLGKTSVSIDGEAESLSDKPEDVVDQTVIFGHVYGGGDVASVGAEPNETPDYNSIDNSTYASTVTIKGGLIFSQIHGGGRGRVNAECRDYSKLGAIYGNTLVEILPHHAELNDGVWSNNNSDRALDTWLWNRIYGGGENGTVYGSTNVSIQGGNIGYNIFGGGWGDVNEDENVAETKRITSADVKGNTHININTISGANAEYCISQIWEPGTTRAWRPVNKKKDGSDTTPYSPQYDPDTQDFIVNHNTYGGGNVACSVDGTAFVTINRGMLSINSTVISGQTGTVFFNTNEWHESYSKHAAPHFSVFGGGYGENTHVNTSNVNIEIAGDEATTSLLNQGENSYKNFANYQSLVDVVGGGYNGSVDDCNVTINGNTFMRNVFGGAYYATTKTAKTSILSCNLDNIYGGGMMGDVENTVEVSVGTADADNTNKSIVILGDVYGANDVSGNVGLGSEPGEKGATINLLGGHIYGNVYGGGNGNYLYAIDGNLDQQSNKVVANEDYVVNGTKKLVFTVPMRDAFGSFKSSNELQRIINIATFRPVIGKTQINMQGNTPPELTDVDLSSKDFLLIDGGVFGGGNSATVADFVGGGKSSSVLNIGSNIKVGKVFLGNDGDAMFKKESSNNFINDFPTLNNLTLSKVIDWSSPEGQSITEEYFPTPKADRPDIYKTQLDLYFVPVEMTFIPTVNWGLQTVEGKLQGMNAGNAETVSTDDLNNVFIGTFCCGGNRGNMTTAEHVNIVFPEGLTITDKIVGGCNDANYILGEGTGNETVHVGGYLKGTHGEKKEGAFWPQIKLTMKNRFVLTEDGDKYKESANVYGGCYQSGNVRGDIEIDMRSNMINGNDSIKMRRSFDAGRSVASIYGGGYGPNTYVYGDTRVTLGQGTTSVIDHTPNPGTTYRNTGASVYNIFGGGQQGNIIGNSFVRVANGRVGGNVVGGSYAGYLYGSTNAVVGYPRYYECQTSGEYTMERADDTEVHKDFDNIKRSAKYLKGAFVSKAVIDAIIAKNTGYHWQDGGTSVCLDGSGNILFKQIEDGYKPNDFGIDAWNKVDIQIDKAVYGGGYSIASSTGAAGAETVKKFEDAHNMDDFCNSVYGFADKNGTPGVTKGYGGNTNVMICDLTPNNEIVSDEGSTSEVDHITLSSEQLKPMSLSNGDLVYGLYYKQGGAWIREKRTSKYPVCEEGTETPIQYYKYIGEGGLYGDGHLSVSEGFRFAEVTGYGYAAHAPENAKLMNCIHRFDIVRVKDCCIALLGDYDYVNAEGTEADVQANGTPYSIARVGELQMNSSVKPTNEGKLPGTRDAKYLRYTEKRVRNYIGLSNTVLDLGAVSSTTPFDGDGATWYSEAGAPENAKTYKAKKAGIIEECYNYTNDRAKSGKEEAFKMRNNGTAPNLIGIASGYALRVQDTNTSGNLYYGPVRGVFEIALINVANDEAGGFVYALNEHEDNLTSGEHSGKHNFLESSGNFVFPKTTYRWVVDNCYPYDYGFAEDSNVGQAKPISRMFKSGTPDVDPDRAEGHYWYVTGYNYNYDVVITGYTSDKPNMQFKMKNDNNSIYLMSAMKGKGDEDVLPVTLRSFEFVHSDKPVGYTCDIETHYTDEESKHGTGYQLSLSLSDVAGTQAKTVTQEYLPELAYEASGVHPVLNFAGDEPTLMLTLTDNVENNTKAYYDAHLSEPCQAVLKLSAPALTKEGYQMYTGDFVLDSDSWSESTKYYFKTSDDQFYLRNLTSEEYTAEKTAGNLIYVLDQDAGAPQQKDFLYTFYITINYLKGPSYTGNVAVNCALPGEMLTLSKGNLVIDTDNNSYPQIGEKWLIGKLQENDETHELCIAETGKETITVKDGVVSLGDDTELRGTYINAVNGEVYIPAYYFMNGYGVQYVATINAIGDVPVTIAPENVLTIHNYHRMKSGKPVGMDNLVNHKLYMAAARAKSEAATYAALTDVQKETAAKPLPMPRAYIEDAEDLAAFKAYISGTTDIDGNTIPAEEQKGSGVDFHLMADLAVPSNFATDFAGNFHGNGHKLSGNALFTVNSGNIYNLGMEGANIANSNGGTMVNCYAYGANLLGTKGGTLTNCYTTVKGTDEASQQGIYATAEEFKYGKIAYNLNSYYIGKREQGTPQEYVDNLFRNGDYLYARHATTANGTEYLRTNALVHYGSPESYHNTAHTLDAARAVYNPAVAEVLYTEEDELPGGKNVGDVKTPAQPKSFKEYQPLMDAVKIDGEATTDVVKNDYLFFGQRMIKGQTVTPTAIYPASRVVADMTNRVRRAYGYMKTKWTGFNAATANTDPGFYFNRDVDVYNPELTAVNFNKATKTDNNIDMPESLLSFSVDADANVTRNLLVYSDVEDNTSTVFKEGVYDESKEESLISYHTINSGETKTIKYFHLVERDDATQPNNDFNAPIAFTVGTRAWYTRQPKYYAEADNSAWEGIALPFTANKVTASLNGEITHFYGTPTQDMIDHPETNDKTLHHEYWLRGLTDVVGSKATYQRPGVFNHADMTKTDYSFNNTWFADTYPNYSSYSSITQNNWYSKVDYPDGHAYTDYPLLTADIPYIVSFPGNRYYEFDLSSEFYNRKKGASREPQSITFSSDETTIKVTDDNLKTITTGGYECKPTYRAINEAPYGMNDDGTSFINTSNDVLPFRTYMAKSSSGGAKYSVIYITGDVENIAVSRSAEHGDPAGDVKEKTMKAYSIKHSIIIDSEYDTDVLIYTSGGQIARAVRVLEGNNVYNGFSPGVYLINGKKLVVR